VLGINKTSVLTKPEPEASLSSYDTDEWEVVMGAFKRGKGFHDKECRDVRSFHGPKRNESQDYGSSYEGGSREEDRDREKEREREEARCREERERGLRDSHSSTSRDRYSSSCPASDTNSRRLSMCSIATTGE
jgi:hypothetical protein